MPLIDVIRCGISHGLMRLFFMTAISLWIPTTFGSPFEANESNSRGDDTAFFETQIRPLLSVHCYQCHGADKMQASLRLDFADGWRVGGDSGPAVIPGNVDESLLVRAVRYEDDQLQMPPEGKLPDEVIARLVEWVRRGAPGGDEGTLSAPSRGWTPDQITEARSFWAYRPLENFSLPIADGRTPSAHPIDRFVDLKLSANGLSPNPRATRATLIRRLTYDLHGLPPTPSELEQFVRDTDPAAYTRLVDRLLASPRFSEHWGRHWLDLVRYAESLTLRGFILPEAWRYRDYVIGQFAVDRPYDEFLREQLAGDLLPSLDGTGHSIDRQQLHDQLVATAFWALGNTNLEEQDKRQLDMDVVDEQLDVLGRAILGQTLQCARCHDHKFDPIPTRDYYALAGILRNTQPLDHANVSQWKERDLPLSESEETYYLQCQAEISLIETELSFHQAIRGYPLLWMARRRTQLEERKATLARRPKYLSFVERNEIADVPIHLRGSVHSLGETVPRGFLQVVGTLGVPSPGSAESGRRELADWITSPDQPLTPRVYVNRVWYWLMGQGLVATVDQFGMTGQPPTHPELLDHLALYFLDHDWSTQRLIRFIVLSDAYQRSSVTNPSAIEKDPENRWIWRMNRRRLEAEAVRDSLRMIGGCLSYERGGPTIRPGVSADYGYEYQLDQSYVRRSVYLPVLRNSLPSAFLAFDFADPSMVVGQRQTSPSVSQSLFLMNDPLVHECAQQAARQLMADHTDMATLTSRPLTINSIHLDAVALRALGRSFSPPEEAVILDTLADHDQRNLTVEESLTELFQMLFASVDFRYRD